MELRPNVVVGVVGLCVFLITGAYIGTNFKDLTEIRGWKVEVFTDDQQLGYKSGMVRGGGEATVTYTTQHANITRILVRVTWEDPAGPVANPHTFTVTVRNPQDQVVAESDATQGGRRGVTLDEILRPVPLGDRFDATEDAKDSRLAKQYPDHRVDRGAWSVTMKATSPEPSGGVVYVVTMEYDYYWVTVEEVPAGGLEK